MTGPSLPGELQEKPSVDAGSGSSGPWRHAWATQIGSMHVARGEVREDAVGVHVLDGAIVAVVADGHGMKRAFRAHVGSELAVRAVVSAALRGRQRWTAAAGDAAAWLAGEFTRDVVAGWRDLVARHATDHPFTEQQSPDGAGDGGDPTALSQEEVWVAYGSTVLVAIAAAGRVLLWQLGDGDVVVASAAGAGESPLPADPANVGNQTSSICLPDAVQRARSVVRDVGTEGFLAVLATDGFGNAMAAPDWRTRLCEDLTAQIAERGFDDVAENLPVWCETCAAASGDDVSVVLLSLPSAAGSAATATTRRQDEPAGPGYEDTLTETIRIPRQSQAPLNAPVLIGALVLVLVAGVLTLLWAGVLTLPGGAPTTPPPAGGSAGTAGPSPLPTASVGLTPSALPTVSPLPTVTASVVPPSSTPITGTR